MLPSNENTTNLISGYQQVADYITSLGYLNPNGKRASAETVRAWRRAGKFPDPIVARVWDKFTIREWLEQTGRV